MKFLLICLFVNTLFASVGANFFSYGAIFILIIPIFLVILLGVYIFNLRLKNEEKKVKIFHISESNKALNQSFERTMHYFDLQEVFLYFFKTLNYEASLKNNTFLVRQDFKYKSEQGVVISTPRNFYGDYSNIINAIWAAANLINQNVENKTIFIDIKIDGLSYGKASLLIDVGVIEEDSKELFSKLQNSDDKILKEQVNQFVQTINKIDGSIFAIKNNTQRENGAICISVPIIMASENKLLNIIPSEVLNILIVHSNVEVIKTLTDNLECFNIKCVHNKNSNNLINKIEDGVNCTYRVVLIEYSFFADFNEFEIDRLLSAQEKYCVKIIVILNNYKNIPNIEKIAKKIDFLTMPYTIDNIRSIVNQARIQHERLSA